MTGETEEAGQIRALVARLLEEPLDIAAWHRLRALPIYREAAASGLDEHMPLARDRAEAIFEAVLAALRQRFHPARALLAWELATRFGWPLPEIVSTAPGMRLATRRIRIPPQDFVDRLTVADHPFQPWTWTHNRPDANRKTIQPFTPFVAVSAAEIERVPHGSRGDFAHVVYDPSGHPILGDMFWFNVVTVGRTLRAAEDGRTLAVEGLAAPVLARDVVFLPNRENYYHFLVETFPAALLAARLPALQGCRLALSRLLPRQRELLELAGVPAERILDLSAETAPRFTLERCWLPVDLPFDLACTICRDGLPTPRRRIAGRRLFVSRAGGGGVVPRLRNEAEILAALRPRGFEPVLAERLTMAEQIALFSGAEMVCGPHGAGLANMLHAPADAILIEILNRPCHQHRGGNFSSMKRICESIGQFYFRVVGETGSDPADGFEPDIPHTADPNAVLRAVDAAEGLL